MIFNVPSINYAKNIIFIFNKLYLLDKCATLAQKMFKLCIVLLFIVKQKIKILKLKSDFFFFD